MAVTRAIAKKLCTQAEYELVEESFAPPVNSFKLPELRKKIDRTRKFRDKFRDLEQRQTAEAKGSRQPSGQRPARGNIRTSQKVQLFTETLTRFEKRLNVLEKRETDRQEREAKAKAKAAEQAKAKERNAKASKARREGTPAGNGKGQKVGGVAQHAAVRGKVIGSHVRAAGKRTQAKRDRSR